MYFQNLKFKIFFYLLFFCCNVFGFERNDLNQLFISKHINQTNLKSVYFNNIISYSGFFNVNKACNNNLFTWFFPHVNLTAPLLIWLQGGPGSSSLFGLFNENGPFIINKDLKLNYRSHSWTVAFSMLYIDNPVGSGFSFTTKNECYARNEEDVSRDLYELLKQFFSIFKVYSKNELYITGESYAGKYIPSIAYKILQNRRESYKYFNLKGIIIGNGFIDPVNQINYSELLYNLGLLDERQYLEFTHLQNKLINLIKQKKWNKASSLLDILINGDFKKSLFQEMTGLYNYFNFLTPETSDESYYIKFLNLPDVRKNIHVNNVTFHDQNNLVEIYLKEDLLKSVADKLFDVSEKIKVLIYNGQLDIICAPVLTENFLKTYNWTNRDNFLKSKRHIWKINYFDTQVAGYIKNYKNFYYAMVRNAGHMVPKDQPEAALDLIYKFIYNNLLSD